MNTENKTAESHPTTIDLQAAIIADLQDEIGRANVKLADQSAEIAAPVEEVALLERQIQNLKRHIAEYCPSAPAAPSEQAKPHSINITLRQAERLVEFFGGHDAEITVTERPAVWEQIEEGLYAYCTEYPEDGAQFLGATETDDELMRLGRAAPAAPLPAQPTSQAPSINTDKFLDIFLRWGDGPWMTESPYFVELIAHINVEIAIYHDAWISAFGIAKDWQAKAEAAGAAPLPELTDAEKLKRQNVQAMADCMCMVRDELVEMGIIDKTVAPMFIPEAVANYCKRLAAPLPDQPELSKLIELDDPELDAKDPFTKLFLLAEYWQREAKKARATSKHLDVDVAAHPDDLAVDRTAAAMKAKMAASRAKGRDGWDNPALCSVEKLAYMLIEHAGKGDAIDVANFAMMLHNRGADHFALSEAMGVYLTKNVAYALTPEELDAEVSGAAPLPELTGPSAELEAHKRMLLDACSDLGLINEALGLDPDDGGADPILDAIEQLKAAASPSPAPAPTEPQQTLPPLDEVKRALHSCSPEEIEAFEVWAAREKYDMTTHPLHWLFLDPETYAARQGWKEGLSFARAAVEAISPASRMGGITSKESAETAAPGASTEDTQ